MNIKYTDSVNADFKRNLSLNTSVGYSLIDRSIKTGKNSKGHQLLKVSNVVTLAKFKKDANNTKVVNYLNSSAKKLKSAKTLNAQVKVLKELSSNLTTTKLFLTPYGYSTSYINSAYNQKVYGIIAYGNLMTQVGARAGVPVFWGSTGTQGYLYLKDPDTGKNKKYDLYKYMKVAK